MSDILVRKAVQKHQKFPGHCRLIKQKSPSLSGHLENPFFRPLPTKSIISSIHNSSNERGSHHSDGPASPTLKVTFEMDNNSEMNLKSRLQDRDLVDTILALTVRQEKVDDERARESREKYQMQLLRELSNTEHADSDCFREDGVYIREELDDHSKGARVNNVLIEDTQDGSEDEGRKREDISRTCSEESSGEGSGESNDFSDIVSDDSGESQDTLPPASRAGSRMSHLRLSHNTRTSFPPKEVQRSISNCVELVKLHFSDVENRLFEMFGNKQTKTINVRKFLAGLLSTGLRADDPRLSEMYENVQDVKRKINKVDDDSLVVDYHTFMGIISENLEIVVRAFSHSFIIPEFRSFCDHVDVLYDHCRGNNEGRAAEYIPQLSRMSTDFWAVSLCTVDGQRYSVGDVKQPFTIQSCSKPLTYAVACADNGPDKMHKFIGLEPSGRFFNELCLDYKNKPHNPMINSGAIMTAALVKPEFSAADRFDYMFEMYKRLAGGEYLGFNNSVFLSEKECADRNFALAYFMRENKCFPTGTKLQETLEFYFQLCSLEITAESGAVMAATLANGGINPLTGDPVLTCEAVRNTLTLMHSCGMYNYSGQFAFKVGLPAKSGVSGCVLLVVPNTIGICLWSPALDVNGNSCRGVQFCSELVNLFRFHHFDNLRGNSSTSTKIDPRVTKTESSAQILFDLLFCVAANDISSLRRHALAGTDLESADYDGRTALHVAASEGHGELVEFLLEKCQVNPAPKDRWQRTPLDDARNFGHPLVEKLLVKFCRQRGIAVPDALVVEKVNGTTKAAGVNQ